MKIENLTHKFGGKITTVKAIAHTTYKRVASWNFIVDVIWDDNSKLAESIEVAPYQVCCASDNDAGRIELNIIFKALNDYLQRQGEWHDAKHTRDGRVYNWTPHNPHGREDL